MARIAKFVVGERDVKPPQSAVDGYVQTVTGDPMARSISIFTTTPREDLKPGDSHQSLHFDYTTAKAFKAIIDETFGSL